MAPRETDLYPPIKAFLEGQGYRVKGEVADCDVVAVRGNEDPVVVELKTAFTAKLVFQAVRRLALTDCVYIAFGIGESKTAAWRRHRRDIVALCRRLGLGLIVVPKGGLGGAIEVHLDPGPYAPRQSKAKRGRLLREFERRVGDPNRGGSSARPVMTAYRQDALRCARFLQQYGPTKAATLRQSTGVQSTPRLLQRDVYGWFERTERGIYDLSPLGRQALRTFATAVAELDMEPAADRG